MSPAGEEQQRALREALTAVGAPAQHAAEVARLATLEVDEGSLMLCLNGHCCQVDDDEDVSACESLADNAAADNAEAHDRQQRGEAGYSPWWPLPDRRPRQ